MKVVQFPSHPLVSAAGGWQSGEVQSVIEACAGSISSGDISAWSIGTTEAGDPQLYLLGPAPDHECLLCISRLGRLYVLEDGQGRVVFEHDAMSILAEQVRSTLRRQKGAITTHAVAAWLAVKETFEERVEPMLAEPAEILAHVAPQLAALV